MIIAFLRLRIGLDVAAAQEAGYEESLVARLVMKHEKISWLAASVCLAEMEEPIGRVLKKIQVVDGLILEKTSSPIVVLPETIIVARDMETSYIRRVVTKQKYSVIRVVSDDN